MDANRVGQYCRSGSTDVVAANVIQHAAADIVADLLARIVEARYPAFATTK